MCKKDIFSVAPGTEMRSPGTLVFCALKIAWEKRKKMYNTFHSTRGVGRTSGIEHANKDMHSIANQGNRTGDFLLSNSN